MYVGIFCNLTITDSSVAVSMPGPRTLYWVLKPFSVTTAYSVSLVLEQTLIVYRVSASL